MSSARESAVAALSHLVCLLIAFCFVAAVLAGAWFCFDDTLAALVGYPPLGEMGYGPVWGMLFFIVMVTTRKGDKSNG